MHAKTARICRYNFINFRCVLRYINLVWYGKEKIGSCDSTARVSDTRLDSSSTMKRKALTERNGSLPEGEDVVREQDELSSSSTSSVSQDESHNKQPDSVKTCVSTHNNRLVLCLQ